MSSIIKQSLSQNKGQSYVSEIFPFFSFKQKKKGQGRKKGSKTKSRDLTPMLEYRQTRLLLVTQPTRCFQTAYENCIPESGSHELNISWQWRYCSLPACMDKSKVSSG